MAEHVYRQFGPADLTSTRVSARPHTVWETGSYGTRGNSEAPSGSMSVYGGVRARADLVSGSLPSSGIELYPVDQVDTQSIDGVIAVAGTYPMTGSIALVQCTNDEPDSLLNQYVTDYRWYSEHYRPIEQLFNFYDSYAKVRKSGSSAVGYALNTGSFDDASGWRLLHVPSMYYGRGIVPGTVKVTDFTSGSEVVISDDGMGSLFASGSDVQVGNVFYSEGLIVSRGAGFGGGALLSGDGTKLRVEFDGETLIDSMVFMCRMSPADVNASNNPTWSEQDPVTGEYWAKDPAGPVYITAIGLYDQDRQLVAVAKLAQPIRKRETDNLDIRLRLDV